MKQFHYSLDITYVEVDKLQSIIIFLFRFILNKWVCTQIQHDKVQFLMKTSKQKHIKILVQSVFVLGLWMWLLMSTL